MWVSVMPIGIGLLSLLLGIWKFFHQRELKKSSDLESRWRHLLDRRATIKQEWLDDIDDTRPGKVAILVGTSNLGELSLETIRDRLRGYVGGEPFDTPSALYERFRVLARLHHDVPKKKREFFKDSLPPRTSTRHVGRGFVHAVEELDGKTMVFLIKEESPCVCPFRSTST